MWGIWLYYRLSCPITSPTQALAEALSCVDWAYNKRRQGCVGIGVDRRCGKGDTESQNESMARIIPAVVTRRRAVKTVRKLSWRCGPRCQRKLGSRNPIEPSEERIRDLILGPPGMISISCWSGLSVCGFHAQGPGVSQSRRSESGRAIWSQLVAQRLIFIIVVMPILLHNVDIYTSHSLYDPFS